MVGYRITGCCSALTLLLAVFCKTYLLGVPSHHIATRISQIFPGSFGSASVYNASEYYNWTALFRDNWQTIRDEFYAYEAATASSCHQNRDYATNWDQKWSTVSVYGWGAFNTRKSVVKHFPVTRKLVAQVLEQNWIRLAEFSILQSGKFIPRHRGVYGGQLTYQLTIEVPQEVNDYSLDELKRKLYLAIWDNTSVPLQYWPSEYTPNVAPSLITWPFNGSDILFDDSCIHEAYNGLSARRVVLIVDPERNDDSFRNSKLAQAIHRFVQWFIPKLKQVQEYFQIEALVKEGFNANIKKGADSCQFNGVNESTFEYDYQAIGNLRSNDVESNITSVRQNWYELMDNDTYQYDISSSSHYHATRSINVDVLCMASVLCSFALTFCVLSRLKMGIVRN